MDPALDVEELENAALTPEARVPLNDGSHASAAQIKDVGQVQENVRPSLEYQRAQFVAQDDVRVVRQFVYVSL